LEIYSICRYDLRLTEKEFLDLSPAQYNALNRRHYLHRQAEDYRAGTIAAIIANVNRKPESKAFEPADFFPLLPKTKDRSMTPQNMLNYMQARFPKTPGKGKSLKRIKSK
jgi:hypothetical protein